MPRQVPLIIAINAAIFIGYGRVRKRWPIAIFGFALLAIAGVLVLLGPGTAYMACDDGSRVGDLDRGAADPR